MNKAQLEEYKVSLKPLLMLFLAVLTVFIAAKTWQELKKPMETINVPAISVSAEGKVFVKPDIGKINISVVNEEATVAEAQTKTTERMNSVIKFLKSSGVEEKDIKTISYSIYPQYNYIKGRQELRGYEVSQSLEIKIRKFEKIGEILSGAAERGANVIGGLNFTVDDEEVVRAEARQKAIENAKAKARKLADGLGVKLGRVISFGEFAYPQPMPIYAKGGIGAELMSAPEIPVGENEIVVNVSITYEIK